jgi:biopolymer transport protein ExbB
VAIPALFAYSYLNSRIKNVVGEMQVFIDEFIAKMAELYQGSDHPNAAQFAAAEKP